MLTINRDDDRAAHRCCLSDQITRHDETFFVGKSEHFAGANGSQNGSEASESDRAREHDVDVTPPSNRLSGGGSTDALDSGKPLRIPRRPPFGQHRHGRVELGHLISEHLSPPTRTERNDRKPFGVGPHDIERCAADRTG
jgi:hypothetical protein